MFIYVMESLQIYINKIFCGITNYSYGCDFFINVQSIKQSII